jgi:acetate kinase
MNSKLILVVNIGSSSIKFQLFTVVNNLELIIDGSISGIGSKPVFNVNMHSIVNFSLVTSIDDAVKCIIDWIRDNGYAECIIAIGYRVVHGGNNFDSPTLLTSEVVERLEGFIPLAPMHQPQALSAIKAFKDIYPNIFHLGCFDTAFHRGHSKIFRTYAIPSYLFEHGIQRYGFHGISYESVQYILHRDYPELAYGRVLAAHLGNGASICAMHDGKSIDTTMGMTALDGLPMGTRCGSIDPGAIFFMLSQMQLGLERTQSILTYESGLKGLSGISSDCRDLIASSDDNAQFAIDFFTMMTAQHIARLAVAVSGIDTLVFTGGIGENHAVVRNKIVAHLNFLQPFKVLTLKSNEGLMIARHCFNFLEREVE